MRFRKNPITPFYEGAIEEVFVWFYQTSDYRNNKYTSKSTFWPTFGRYIEYVGKNITAAVTGKVAYITGALKREEAPLCLIFIAVIKVLLFRLVHEL